jgi:SPP1 gp7 family putative phage head morphogenesis protein
LNPEILALLEKYNRAIANMEDVAIARLNAAIDQSYRNLERELRAKYPAIAENGSLTAMQQKVLIANDLNELLQLIKPGQQQEYEQLMTNLLQLSSETGATLADQLVRAIAPDSPIRQFTGIPLDAVALQAQDGVKRLYRHSEDFRGKASAIVEMGLTQQWGPARVATALRGQLGATKSKAETIARTEVLSALNDAAQQRYQNNGVEAIQWVCTIGEVCPICVARNTQVYPVGKVRVPAHPRCRCMVVPWKAAWAEMGLLDDEFTEEYREKRLEDLKKVGLKPNPGLSPFEKAAGLSEPPSPLWKIGEPLPKPPAPPAPPKPSKAKAADFPIGIEKLEQVRSLGGSTGATLVRDPETGKQYVLKRGNNAAHLREEVAADKAYRALGVPTPKVKLYETETGPVKLSQFVEGRSLAEVLKGDPKEAAKVMQQVRRNFAADALLGNWDVAGMNLDNILVGKDGKAYRIDNGVSLRFRAQGEMKGTAWNRYPTELWSMRDGSTNLQSARLFGDVKHFDLVGQIEAISKREAKLMRSLPVDLRGMVGDRLAEMRRLAQVSRTLEADAWREDYIGGFARHSLGLRATGLIERLPRELRQQGKESTVVDENGRSFDHLRGAGSHMLALRDYINSNGGSYKSLQYWMQGQAGSSWSSNSRAYKWYLANQRTVPIDNYYWQDGLDASRSKFNLIVQKVGGESIFTANSQAWHAFNYELMNAIEFNNRNDDGTVTLIRTEDLEVMQMYNLTPGDRNIVMLRGAAESTSIYSKVSVHGTEVTMQQVPLHRIFGTYFYERHPGQGGSAFMGDSENEFIALLEGIPFDYIKEK